MDTPSIYEAFGLRLSALRRERGLSQQALADALSVTRQAVSNWERGQTTPDLGTMEALCRVLEVDWNRLCGGTASPAPRRSRLSAVLPAAGRRCWSWPPFWSPEARRPPKNPPTPGPDTRARCCAPT